MIGEIVVVFDWLKGGGFAEEAEVVNWDGVGEQGFNGWVKGLVRQDSSLVWGWKKSIPSTMPRPERRIGTRARRGVVVSAE